MKWFEVNLLISEEDIAVDVVEGEYTAGQDVCLGYDGLLGDTFDQAHVEGSFIELLDDHFVYFFLHVIVIFLTNCVIEETNPLLQISDLLVGRHHLYFFPQVLVYLERLWRTISSCFNCRHSRGDKCKGVLGEHRHFFQGFVSVFKKRDGFVIRLVDERL